MRIKDVFNQVKILTPGILICFIVMIIGVYLAELIGILLVKADLLPAGSASPISGIFVAILIGVIIRNFIGLHRYLWMELNFH